MSSWVKGAKPTATYTKDGKPYALDNFLFQSGNNYLFQSGNYFVFEKTLELNWSKTEKPS